jgi:hypothetical protein
MSESQTDRINYSFKVKNETTEIKRAEFSTNRTDEILVKPVDYEVQAKSFNIDLHGTPLISSSNQWKIIIQTTNLPFNSPPQYYSGFLSNQVIFDPTDFVSNVNSTLNDIITDMKNDIPLLQGLPDPKVTFTQNGDISFFTLNVPDSYYSTAAPDPYSIAIFFDNNVNRALNIPSFPSKIFTDGDYHRVILDRNDFTTKVVNSITYYYVNGSLPASFSDIDQIVLESKSIPLQNTLEGTQKDIETKILKIVRPSYKELNELRITREYTQEDYYSLISHYPLKQIDFEISIIRTSGEKEVLTLLPTNSLSCNIEFKKKQIF